MQTKIIFSIIALIFIFPSCFNCEEGNGLSIKKSFKIDENPSNFKIEISAEITIIQSDTNLITIETDSNFISLITVEQSRNKIVISSSKCLDYENNININIKSKNFEEISIEGSSKLKSQNQITTKNLEINADGASSISLNIKTEKIEIDCDGSNEIKIIGITEKLDVELSGSGVFIGDKLNAKKAYIDIKGSSNASVRCTKLLDANLSGSSTLKYFGNPAKVNSDVNGSAKIVSK